MHEAAEFVLDTRLAADCHRIGRLALCELLLMNDARYPWFILVPRRTGVREIYELSEADQTLLLNESVQLGRSLMQLYSGDKLNVAALGNIVPQLHLHHIVRHAGDPAWPGPVWGHTAAQAYTPKALRSRIELLMPALPDGFIPA